MLFALGNLKRRSVRETDGEMAVVPKLLHGRTALRQVEQAIDLFEGALGRSRAGWDPRALEAIMGDYRLARCIEACLLTAYAFVQPTFDDLLTPKQIADLRKSGIESPCDVRFAIWDAANTMGGFAPAGERKALLSSLAARWGLPPDPALLDTLARLDSEAAAILTRRSGTPPLPAEVITLYNRGAVKTLLAHSTRLELALSRLPGSALKRLYFLARRRGILVDIEPRPAGFAMTLYGPEQAFGTADKYGRRLADVGIDLVRTLLSEGGEVEATTHILLHERPYRFHVTPDLLARLEYAPPTHGRIAERAAPYSVGASIAAQGEEHDAPEEPSFDSLVEARLYREFCSLQKGGYTHGWGVQREPEPLVAPGVVLIPDFGFRRGETHVLMEIAGFWSPTYRERKVAKLRALSAAQDRERPAMILAVPREGAEAFAGLPFPVITYKNKLAATDILNLLDREFGGVEARREAAQAKAESVRAAAREAGFMGEQEMAGALQAYTRSELLALAPQLSGDGLVYVPGAGLFTEARLGALRAGLAQAVRAAPGMRLETSQADTAVASLLGRPLSAESLLPALEGFAIERPSLFEAYLTEEGEEAGGM